MFKYIGRNNLPATDYEVKRDLSESSLNCNSLDADSLDESSDFDNSSYHPYKNKRVTPPPSPVRRRVDDMHGNGLDEEFGVKERSVGWVL